MEKLAFTTRGEILRTVLLKEELVEATRVLEVLNFTCGLLSVIYLAITNSIGGASNIIFANIMIADAHLNTHPLLTNAVLLLFLALNLKITALTLALTAGRIRQEWSEQPAGFHHKLHQYLAYWLIVYEIVVAPCSILCMRYLGNSYLPISFLTFALILVIISAFRLRLLYGRYFLVVAGLTLITTPPVYSLCLAFISALLVLRDKREMGIDCLYLLLVIAYSFIIFANTNLATDISLFHLLTITIAVPAIYFYVPPQMLSKNSHEALLAAIVKLYHAQPLSKSEERFIYRILHELQEEAQNHGFAMKEDERRMMQNLHKCITKDGLCGLMKAKLSLEKAIDPLNLMLDIQMAESELYRGQCSMEVLMRIENASRSVEERGTFEERLRMMKVIHRLQSQFINKDEKVSSIDIVRVEKCSEAYNNKLDDILALYTSFWRSLHKTNEEQMMKILKKLSEAEAQCQNLLAILKNYKDVKMQTLIFNSIQRSLNNSSVGEVSLEAPKQRVRDLGETKFIMVYNNTIVDVSEQLASQIQTSRKFLIGVDIFAVIPEEFHHYYRANINNWLNSDRPDARTILPFASLNSTSMFFPYECTFRVLPEVEGGIKYLIQARSGFISQNQSFLLYSLRQDQITKLSKSFYQEYATAEDEILNFTAEELLGLDLTFLANYTKMQANEEKICEVNMKKLEKKISSKRSIMSHQHVLKLVEIYELNENRLFLLALMAKSEEKAKSINDIITIEDFKFTDKKGSRSVNELTTFCKIRNPFEQVLEERLNYRNSNRILTHTYMRTIIIIFIIILCLGVATFLQYNSAVNGSVGSLSQEISNYASTLGNYEAIYLLFYQYYIYIHSLIRPQDFVLPRSQIKISSLQAQYKSKVVKTLNSLLAIAADPSVKVNPIPFQLIYPQYELDGSLDSVTMLPLLQGITSSLSSQDFSFVIRNSEVVDLYINSLMPIDTNILHEAEQRVFLYMLGVGVVMMMALILVKAQYMKIRGVLWRILDLYGQISKECIHAQHTLIRKLKAAIKGNKLQTSRQCKEENSQIGPSGIQPIIKDRFILALISGNLILITIVVCWSFFCYYCYQQLSSYGREVKLVIDYASQVQLISKINTASAEVFYRMAMQELLPFEQRTQWNRTDTIDLPKLFQIALPESFDDFVLNQANLLRQNICQRSDAMSAIKKDIFLSTMNCTLVMSDVLTKGFNQAFPYFFHNIIKHDGILLNSLAKDHLKNSIYPFFAEVIYCRRALDSVIENLNSAFSIEINSFLTDKEAAFKILIGIAFILLGCVIGLMGSYLWKIRGMCVVALKCFSALPRKLIYDIKVSKFLMRDSILDQIQYLNF